MIQLLLDIHHVAIIASDYEKSRHFYTKILELPILNEEYREERASYKLDLKVGNTQIELFSFPSPPERVNNPEAAGLRHLCFKVKYVEKTVEWLKEKGVQCEEIRVDASSGKQYTFFKDPDELPLELYEI